MTILVVEGDCEKSVLLVSQEWVAASEKIKAIPGLLEAMERKDDAEVRRLLLSRTLVKAVRYSNLLHGRSCNASIRNTCW